MVGSKWRSWCSCRSTKLSYPFKLWPNLSWRWFWKWRWRRLPDLHQMEINVWHSAYIQRCQHYWWRGLHVEWIEQCSYSWPKSMDKNKRAFWKILDLLYRPETYQKHCEKTSSPCSKDEEKRVQSKCSHCWTLWKIRNKLLLIQPTNSN